MPPRRSHKKSRAGCQRCKARKIKCDEIHPRCGNCVKHGVPCDFERPELVDELQSATTPRPDTLAATSPVTATTPFDFASPLPPTSAASPAESVTLPLCPSLPAPAASATTPPASRLLELRLLHHYTTGTSRTLSFSARGTEAIWRDIVPSIAFAGSHHLTDAVLAVAALHLRSLCPNDKDLVRASHAYMASSLREYNETLTKGITASNAEALFLTSTLIAFQSTATRAFTKDDLSGGTGTGENSLVRSRAPPGGYSIPLAWFHAFQGVKAVTAASWPFVRNSQVVVPIIDSQPVLNLDLAHANQSFFGHLLDGLDEELGAIPPSPTQSDAGTRGFPDARPSEGMGLPADDGTLVGSTRQAYEHAVAVLNWAHKIPHKGAPLAFPATVSRRFVELIEERRPRALAILASYFAMLKSMDSIWWLQGISRREVLGVISLFSSDFFGAEVERQWWPHLQWAVRVALYDDSATPGYIPPEVWGGNWSDEETVLPPPGTRIVSHIDVLTRMIPGFDPVM